MNDGGDKRIDPVIELLTSLACGDLEARGERFAEDEDLDAVMLGINMLAEELAAHRSELEQRVATRTAELEVARAEALEGSRLKSEFLATMSHEIRTPMNGVIGLTGLLLQSPLDETQRQYAEGVQQAGQALLGVINDILDFSKLEAGMVEFELIDFEPRLLVEGVASLLALTASGKGLELIAYCRPEVPIRLVGDEGRLRQILLNLASNAVKFTDTGEVVLTARTAGDRAGRPLLRFEVADTGIGIPAEAQRRLFDSFTQADASTTRRFGGTGLGLAICQRLAEAMGGEIGVDSEKGVGSTFWFEVALPIAAAGPAKAAAPIHDRLRGLRVLVVDDNATNRLVLRSQLASWGMRPDVVEDPRTALSLMRDAAAAGDAYAVAVLDMCMPDMDGLELAGLVSADHGLAGTQLIMLSSALGVTGKDLERVGVREWLSKPVRSSELFDRLVRMMAPAVAPSPASTVPLSRVPSGTRGRVLVVEDNSLNQLVARGVVAALGYEVDIAANGSEALTAIADADYSAVLMDCHMPVMDGFAATEQIRLLEGPGERLPIIAMTAGVMPEERERCRAVGMDSFVAKPISVAALGEALDAWARPHRTTAEDASSNGPRQHSRPVIDPHRLAALRNLGPDDGWGLLPALTNMFLKDFPSHVLAMRSAVSSGDASGLREAAHQLKGVAANMGATRVIKLCHHVETTASDATCADLKLLDQLEVELEHAAQFLSKELTASL